MIILSPTRKSSAPETSKAWSPSRVFAIILTLSVLFTIREWKAFNAAGLSVLKESVEKNFVAPTAYVSWTSSSALKENTSEIVIEKTESKKLEATNRTISTSGSESLISTNKTVDETTKLSSATNSSKAILPAETGVGGSANQTIETSNFKRYDRVVIATKIHGPHQWKLLDQSMCLLHHAYNHKVLYDIVVFTTTEVPKDQIETLEQVVSPAKLSIVVDNMGFQEEVKALSPAKYSLFLERCQVTDPVNLDWWSNCREPGVNEGDGGRIAYNWQAEFRSVRIWEHPALKEYKYMLWLDSDGFPSKPWENDPVGYFIEKKGVIMFDNFPQGKTAKHTQQILDSFNVTVCALHVKNGHLQRTLLNQENRTECRSGEGIPMIHGFFHITDLDFYRQPKVLNGLKGLLGDCFLCRSPDDQLAVTLPAAIYAPEKSFDMRSNGFNLKVYHNFRLDGKNKAKPPGFVKYWDTVASHDFPSAAKACRVTQRDR